MAFAAAASAMLTTIYMTQFRWVGLGRFLVSRKEQPGSSNGKGEGARGKGRGKKGKKGKGKGRKRGREKKEREERRSER